MDRKPHVTRSDNNASVLWVAPMSDANALREPFRKKANSFPNRAFESVVVRI
jgi:hypothetical protein